jgi:hypothetical protein
LTPKQCAAQCTLIAVPIVELLERPSLAEPVLVVALDGWVNAGSAGTTAAESLARGGTVIAQLDADALFDYRQSRPTIEFTEGVMESVTWPELNLYHRRLGPRDLLILTGIEPNWNWQRLGTEVADVAIELEVVEGISLGGIPWAAPHTRPVTVITTASSRDRLDSTAEFPDGALQVPASAVSTVEFELASRGIGTTGFWARVPHYVGSAYLAAGLALVEQIAHHLSLDPPLRELAEKAAEQRLQLDAIVAGRRELAELVSRLEALHDAAGEVSGERLAAEIERYLRRQNGGPIVEEG